MNEDKSGWFSAKELAYLRNPDSIDSKHRSTVRDRIEEKVNEEVIYDIERIPELLDFLESTTEESIRLQSEPAYVGRGLGALYPDQLDELMFGLLLSEMRPDEATEEFMERFDTIWEEVGADVRRRIENAQLSHEVRSLFRTFTRELFEKANLHASLAQVLWDVKIRIPVDEFVEWTVAQKGKQDLEYLPEVFGAAFGITGDDSPPRRLKDYLNLLLEAAVDNDIEPPDGTTWRIDPKNPSPRDQETHEAALSGLDDELRKAAHQFWEEAQVYERDQLLAFGLYTVSKLEPRDKQILDRIPSSNRGEGWNRYDTRRANILTDDRDLPLLSRETIPKYGADEKRYKFTPYGRFVHWLISYVENKGSYPEVLRDFLTDAPEDLMDEANVWVTEYTGAARRLDSDSAVRKGPSDGEESDEFDDLIMNSVLWIRVAESTDDAKWEGM